MCHSMPQCHLLEWQEEEEEQTSARCSSWMPSEGVDNTVLATVNHIYMMLLEIDEWYFGTLCVDSVRCNHMV